MSGFFGCVSKRDCVADVFYGTDYHSHLGTKRGGMAFYDGKDFVRTIHSLENAYFRNKFEDDLPRFEGSRQGIGIISDMESQPITLTSHLGRFSLVAIGRIDNLEELTRELLGRRLNFAELSASRINPTELVATLVSLGDSFREGIELVQSKVKGSCSMLILTPEGIYASRDKYGRTPVVVGRGGDGYAIATESSAFANLDYRVETELKPAQTLFITADGIREITPGGKRKQICSFMWVYYGYPSSCYEGVNVEDARYRCGCALACRDEDVRDVDLVAGVPDSGVPPALGFAQESGIPYADGIVKNRYVGRTFIQPTQAMRQLGIRLKLNPLPSVISGKRLVVIDDSIVRGNTSKKLVQMLRDAGAAEVHLRIVSPEVLWPCFYGIDTDTREQLIAANMTLEEMNDWIGSDSLAFISLDGLRASLADAGHDGFCTACFTGDYPVPIPDDVAKKSFLTRKDFEAVYAGEVS